MDIYECFFFSIPLALWCALFTRNCVYVPYSVAQYCSTNADNIHFYLLLKSAINILLSWDTWLPLSAGHFFTPPSAVRCCLLLAFHFNIDWYANAYIIQHEILSWNIHIVRIRWKSAWCNLAYFAMLIVYVFYAKAKTEKKRNERHNGCLRVCCYILRDSTWFEMITDRLSKPQNVTICVSFVGELAGCRLSILYDTEHTHADQVNGPFIFIYYKWMEMNIFLQRKWICINIYANASHV